jgi:hypothetical protein
MVVNSCTGRSFPKYPEIIFQIIFRRAAVSHATSHDVRDAGGQINATPGAFAQGSGCGLNSAPKSVGRQLGAVG